MNKKKCQDCVLRGIISEPCKFTSLASGMRLNIRERTLWYSGSQMFLVFIHASSITSSHCHLHNEISIFISLFVSSCHTLSFLLSSSSCPHTNYISMYIHTYICMCVCVRVRARSCVLACMRVTCSSQRKQLYVCVYSTDTYTVHTPRSPSS